MICPSVHSRSVAAVGFEPGSGALSPDCTAPWLCAWLLLIAWSTWLPVGPRAGVGNPFPLAFFVLISQPLPSLGSVFEGRAGGHTSRFPGSRAISAGEVLGPQEASLLSCWPCALCPGRPGGLEDRICLSLGEVWGVSPGHRAHSTLSSPHLLSQPRSSDRLCTQNSCCRVGREPDTSISCKGCRCEEGTASFS